jgi:hypothetical protein
VVIARSEERTTKQSPYSETFEKCSILFKFKEGENFNRKNILNILRIALKLHCVPKFEPDTEIGQKGASCKGLILRRSRTISRAVLLCEEGVIHSYKAQRYGIGYHK